MGSGKTTTARWIAQAFRIPCISTDDYIAIRNGELSYPTRLARAALRRAVQSAIHRRRYVIVEGLCLRSVARRMECKPAAYIYVRRVSRVGLWNDGLNLEDFATDSLESVVDDGREFGQMSYHLRHEPHLKADIVFSLTEGQQWPNLAFERTPICVAPVRERSRGAAQLVR